MKFRDVGLKLLVGTLVIFSMSMDTSAKSIVREEACSFNAECLAMRF